MYTLVKLQLDKMVETVMNNLILAKIISLEEKRTTRSNYTRKMDSDKERIKDFVAVICIRAIRILLITW